MINNMGKKKYILTREQLNNLIENKKVDKKIVDNILDEIKLYQNKINESIGMENVQVGIIKKHLRKGKITPNIVTKLIENKIPKEILISAGINIEN
jgi:hypothetical protein